MLARRVMSTLRIVCVAAFVALFPLRAAADELRLKNGDRYSGTVVALQAGTLTFKTPHGDLAVPWQEVDALIVEDAIDLTTGTGETRRQTGGSIDVATTTALARPQPPLVVTGGAAAGFIDAGGNTDVNSVRIDADAVVRHLENRYTFGGAVNRARTSGIETARNWTATGRYDRFLTKRLFVTGSTILTNDPFRDLDLRTALGAGVGYQVLDTAAARLSVEGGVGHVRENFALAPDDSYGALREAAKLEVLLATERVTLFHQHDTYVGVTGDDNLFVKAQTGVRLALLAGFVTTAQLDLDYDRTPAPARRSTDRTFSLTLGYRF